MRTNFVNKSLWSSYINANRSTSINFKSNNFVHKEYPSNIEHIHRIPFYIQKTKKKIKSKQNLSNFPIPIFVQKSYFQVDEIEKKNSSLFQKTNRNEIELAICQRICSLRRYRFNIADYVNHKRLGERWLHNKQSTAFTVPTFHRSRTQRSNFQAPQPPIPPRSLVALRRGSGNRNGTYVEPRRN